MSYYGQPLGGANWPYTAYLIERGSPAEFWVGGDLSTDNAGKWTTDAEKALKFHTETEARQTANRVTEAGHGTVRVCDHIFSCGVA